MFTSYRNRKAHRKGSVTIIVMAFLILFLVLGLTFALESQWRMTSSQIHLQGEFGGHTGVTPVARTGSGDEAPPIPSDIYNHALSYVIYDAPDDPSGVWVDTRGHSLARSMYGYNTASGLNVIPYNGIGRIRGNPAPTGSGLSDDFYAVHYIPYNTTGAGVPNAVRDPEWTSERALAAGKTGTYIPGNPNYTYADINNMYLGVVHPSTGSVLVKSFDRPWIYGNAVPPFSGYPTVAYAPALTAANTNAWTSVDGRHRILRPRPVDHVFNGTSEFPYPRSNNDAAFQANGLNSYGDVQNLESKNGFAQLDSFWMDFDLPVRKWRGKSYKPLVALLIVDHDGRLNLNVAGNKNGAARGHSNQGWGPWEMSFNTYVTGAPIQDGATFNGLPVTGKFGNPGGSSVQKRAMSYAQTGMMDPHYGSATNLGEVITGTIDAAPFVTPSHFYARMDYDGSYAGAYITNKAVNPTNVAPYSYATNVLYGAPGAFKGATVNSYSANSAYHDGQTGTDRGSHLMLFNPYWSRWLPDTTTNIRDTAFAPNEMRWLNGKYMFDSDFQMGRLGRLQPTSLGGTTSTAANARWQLTTFSNDLDRPGGSAWTTTSTNFVQGGTGPYPVLSGATENANIGATNAYQNGSGQLLAAALTGIDINRPLTDYRNTRTVAYSSTSVSDATRFNTAVRDRQNLSRDIFARLVLASGMQQFDPSVETQGTARFNAYRQLAQYAVNLVDFIDNDDYSTPFNWNPGNGNANILAGGDSQATIDSKMRAGWVFGVERNRLVINEAYVRYENDPNDNGPPNPPKGMAMNNGNATLGHQVKVYLELHNCLTPPTANEIGLLSDGGRAVLTENGQQNYRVLITKQNVDLPRSADAVTASNITPGHAENVLGWPNKGNGATGNFGSVVGPADLDASVKSIVTFANNTFIEPNVLSGTPAGPNNSYAIVGPSSEWQVDRYQLPEKDPMTPANTLPPPPTTPHIQATGLEYILAKNELVDISASNPNVGLAPWAPTFLLQKRACQHMPGGADTLACPNPFITVDTMDLRKPGQPEDYFLNDGLKSTYGLALGRPIMDNNANLANHYSAVRPSPMEGRTFNLVRGLPVGGAGANKINQNLGVATTNQTLPFAPYIHLDRMISSVGELMMAPQTRQHEVNMYFFTTTVAGQTRWAHVIPWQQNNGRLYRALDLLRPRSQISHMASGGRVPGRININSIRQDTLPAVTNVTSSGSGVFDCLVDAHHANGQATTMNNFLATDRDAAYAAILAFRRGPDGVLFTEDDRPIVGTVNPDAPRDASGNSTDRFSPNPGIGRTLFQPNLLHREGAAANAGWQHYEMLSKVSSNLTTRSNSFAVYATVGYFEVRNPGPYHSGNRPILGKELGIDDGSNVRHKFFSLVDRTNLTFDSSNTALAGQPNVYFSYEPYLGYEAAVPEPGTSLQIAVPATSIQGSGATGTLYGNYDGTMWQINPSNAFVTIGYGANAQALTVTAVNLINSPSAANPTGLITVTLPAGRKYYRGEVITLRNPNPVLPASSLGNPGPQPRFNYNSPLYRAVVPYTEQTK